MTKTAFIRNVDLGLRRVDDYAGALVEIARENLVALTSEKFVSRETIRSCIEETMRDNVLVADGITGNLSSVRLDDMMWSSFANGLESWVIGEMIRNFAKGLRTENRERRYPYWRGLIEISETIKVRFIILDNDFDELVYTVIVNGNNKGWTLGDSLSLYWGAFHEL